MMMIDINIFKEILKNMFKKNRINIIDDNDILIYNLRLNDGTDKTVHKFNYKIINKNKILIQIIFLLKEDKTKYLAKDDNNNFILSNKEYIFTEEMLNGIS